ncbi:uncharacterized protein LOC123395227 [Hordeum vulgare subsp. vulgare]|uniref:uncharacterized protein LOC123395227 n=1 Tax=Hordeum vulgare subsp. vulgare TaxID=112509 RepID=UPI000B47CD6F|nr:uncharacterized protein LOC123395227 [Hordeum vulgare subsp. vulgare]
MPARPGLNGLRAELRDYDQPEVEAIRWEALGSGFAEDVVLLRHVDGRYHRANGRYLHWNATGVSVDDSVSSMMHWIVETTPFRDAGMPAIPGPLPTRPRFSAIFTRRGAERQIRGVEPIPGEEGMPAAHGPNGPRFSSMFSSLGRRIRFVRALEDGYYPPEVNSWPREADPARRQPARRWLWRDPRDRRLPDRDPCAGGQTSLLKEGVSVMPPPATQRRGVPSGRHIIWLLPKIVELLYLRRQRGA